eukprot:1156210-Pelagomonas_calceolata.AAC.2
MLRFGSPWSKDCAQPARFQARSWAAQPCPRAIFPASKSVKSPAQELPILLSEFCKEVKCRITHCLSLLWPLDAIKLPVCTEDLSFMLEVFWVYPPRVGSIVDLGGSDRGYAY